MFSASVAEPQSLAIGDGESWAQDETFGTSPEGMQPFEHQRSRVGKVLSEFNSGGYMGDGHDG